jgi:cell division transport system ATP-binding protein
MIRMIDVAKTYGHGVAALTGVNIVIPKGDFVFIVGPSGAGKSTFIKMIFREALPSSGSIVVNDKNIVTMTEREVPYLRRSLGIVFQDFRLLPNKTVYENVAFALEVIEAPRREVQKKVPAVLDLVGLWHKAKVYPNQMSGGEQQRVAIARAIVNNPALVIADEPTGNLDPDTSWEIMRILEHINRAGTTIVMATHAKSIVNTMKKRVIAIEKGRVVRDEQKGGYGYED